MNIHRSEGFFALNGVMHREVLKGPEVYWPSRFWQDLNAKHAERLEKHGIENFRRTLARDYFTWTRVLPWDSQIRFLMKSVGPKEIARAALSAFRIHRGLGVAESVAQNFLTSLAWSYLEKTHPEYSWLPDAEFGNAPTISRGGRAVSQDVVNSALEYNSFKSAVRGTICELGGGYGRNAYVTAKLGTFERYILCDIPPALAVAQTFIENTFPERKIFRFRPFDDFESIREEYEAADFVILLPHQLEMLPDQSVDLFINISSLHEMRHDQVAHYLNSVRRLTRGYFYLKAWEHSNNPDPEVAIHAENYDLSGFETVFWRTPPIQTRFFETLQKRTMSA